MSLRQQQWRSAGDAFAVLHALIIENHSQYVETDETLYFILNVLIVLLRNELYCHLTINNLL